MSELNVLRTSEARTTLPLPKDDLKAKVITALGAQILERLSTLSASEETELRNEFARINDTVYTATIARLILKRRIRKETHARTGVSLVALRDASPGEISNAAWRFLKAKKQSRINRTELYNMMRAARNVGIELDTYFADRAWVSELPEATITSQALHSSHGRVNTALANAALDHRIARAAKAITPVQETHGPITDPITTVIRHNEDRTVAGASSQNRYFNDKYTELLESATYEDATIPTKELQAFPKYRPQPSKNPYWGISEANWRKVRVQVKTGQGFRNTARALDRQIDYDWMLATQEEAKRHAAQLNRDEAEIREAFDHWKTNATQFEPNILKDTPEAVEARHQRYQDFWDRYHAADVTTQHQMRESEYGKRIIRNEELVG